MRTNSWLLVGFLGLSLLLAACGGGSSTTPPAEARSDKQRVTSPSAADVPALVAGNTALALEMYRALRQDGQNLFFSPYSISIALGMTWAGARGGTEAQMATALRFGLDQNKLHPAFDYLDLALTSRGQGAKAQDGKAFRLRIVNQLFGQTGYPFLPAFLDVLAQFYGAGMQLLDFMADPEAGRKVINDWVAEQTEDRILDLIPAGNIDSLTRLVLVNAIYFNAAWKEVFDDKATHDADFKRLDGTTVKVPMMVQPKSMPYAEGPGWAAVDLAYDGDELSMVVIVPEAGKLAELEESLTADKLGEILGGLGRESVTVNLPRFKLKGASVLLKGILAALGMPDAFVHGVADFSGMDGSRDLYIGNVIHKAFISVNEYGTEAAAATAVIMEGSGIPRVLTVDRPFIYLIRDLPTNTVLFLGRVTDPTNEG